MVDLKKEIKFSDLLPKRKPKEPRAEEDDEPKKEKRKRTPREKSPKRAKKLVGLKIGGSQLAAARVVNNGSPELVQVAREKLDHGLVVGGELREPELLSEQ